MLIYLCMSGLQRRHSQTRIKEKKQLRREIHEHPNNSATDPLYTRRTRWRSCNPNRSFLRAWDPTRWFQQHHLDEQRRAIKALGNTSNEVADTSRISSNDCYSIVPRVPDRDLRAEFVKIQGSGQLDVRRFQIRFCRCNCVHDWPTLVAMVQVSRYQ